MATFSERLLGLRKQKGMSQNDLAIELNVNKQTISQYERGVRRPDLDTLGMLADFFNVSSDYLIGKTDRTIRLMDSDDLSAVNHGYSRMIPLFAYVSCGSGACADNNIVGRISLPDEYRNKNEYFALTVRGDSMSPKIPDESIIIVHKQETADDGNIVIVIVNGDTGTCKKIHKHKNGIALESLNPNYEPKYFSSKEIEELPVVIAGRVVEVRTKI